MNGYVGSPSGVSLPIRGAPCSRPSSCCNFCEILALAPILVALVLLLLLALTDVFFFEEMDSCEVTNIRYQLERGEHLTRCEDTFIYTFKTPRLAIEFTETETRKRDVLTCKQQHFGPDDGTYQKGTVGCYCSKQWTSWLMPLFSCGSLGDLSTKVTACCTLSHPQFRLEASIILLCVILAFVFVFFWTILHYHWQRPSVPYAKWIKALYSKSLVNATHTVSNNADDV